MKQANEEEVMNLFKAKLFQEAMFFIIIIYLLKIIIEVQAGWSTLQASSMYFRHETSLLRVRL